MAEASTSTSHKSTFFVGESISVCVGVRYVYHFTFILLMNCHIYIYITFSAGTLSSGSSEDTVEAEPRIIYYGQIKS